MEGKRPILLVEDDDDLREAMAENLAATREFDVTAVGSLAQADAAIAANGDFAAIILDLGLPDGNGREWCVNLRSAGHHMPIIMATGATDESDVVNGLDAGANDYVSKPIRSAELIARINRQLQLAESSIRAVFKFGPWIFRPADRLLTDGSSRRRVKLTEKEAAILRFLYQANERPINRETLLDKVWGYNAGVTTHTLETHIYRLRQKVENDPKDFRLLVTESAGYRLNRMAA
ncbi:MAG: response regulator transcription factor [Acetobacteraceae bacterium]